MQDKGNPLQTWKSHTRYIAVLCFLVVLAFSSKAKSTANPRAASPQISVKSELVVLPVSVTDNKGEFVAGLKRDDFRVLENGKPQAITVFAEQDTPVTVGLLVDHSASMEMKLEKITAAAGEFARLSNRDDEMFVVNFNERVTLPMHAGSLFTNDGALLESMIGARRADGQTALYDAMAAGLAVLRRGHHQRKALVIVSDGGDDASGLTYKRILAMAQESQSTIYAIGLIGGPMEEQENPKVLRHFSEETGGLAYFPTDMESAAADSALIARDLRQQYTIGYVPAIGDAKRSAGKNEFRTLKVQIVNKSHGKVRVRTRVGYSLASTPESSQISPGDK